MTGAPRTAAKTGPSEGEAYWFYGSVVVIRSPEGATPIIIEHRLEPGTAASLHVHHRLEDSFYLAAGRLAIRCGDDTFVADTGDYVSLPMAVPHTLRVLGDDDAVMLQTHADPSFLNFVRSVGLPAAEGRPDMATLDFASMNARRSRHRPTCHRSTHVGGGSSCHRRRLTASGAGTASHLAWRG